MSVTPQNVVRHELIGLVAEVVKSRNKVNVGLKGKIADESYKTLVIGGKRVFKDAVTVVLTLPSRQKVEVDGHLLVARPWDRVKKKLSKW